MKMQLSEIIKADVRQILDDIAGVTQYLLPNYEIQRETRTEAIYKIIKEWEKKINRYKTEYESEEK